VISAARRTTCSASRSRAEREGRSTLEPVPGARDVKGALRVLAITVFGAGGYGLVLKLHEFSGWADILLTGVSVGAQVRAMLLAIEEGRAKERAKRERADRG
jgi:hypothetical protein